MVITLSRNRLQEGYCVKYKQQFQQTTNMTLFTMNQISNLYQLVSHPNTQCSSSQHPTLIITGMLIHHLYSNQLPFLLLIFDGQSPSFICCFIIRFILLIYITISIFRYSFVILIAMKFCKTDQIQEEDQPLLTENENHHPNLPTNQLPQTIHHDITHHQYQAEIQAYILSKSNQPRADQAQMRPTPDISQYMRGILISWLVQVHQKYKLMGETFFLTIKIIDTYLLSQAVARNRLQLLGIAALWIAAKYQQTYQVPKLTNLVFICDNAYSASDIMAMEGDVIQCVGFHILGQPSILTYYDIIQRKAQLNAKDYWLGRYLLEAATFDQPLQKYSPANLSFALVFFIKKLRNYSTHSEHTLKEYICISDQQIRSISRELCSLWQKLQRLECVGSLRMKYGGVELMQVSKIRLTERGR